jgi:hypothetical protein
MRPTFIKPIVIIAIVITATSCSEQSLQGKWKLRQIDVMDISHQKKEVTLDLTDPEKMKSFLYEQNLPKEQDLKPGTGDTSNNEYIDTTIDLNAMKADIDKFVESTLNTSMTLEKDKSFFMNSYGLIVPTALPGWHFGDSLKGSWTKSGDTLILSTGAETQRYQWKFKILQLTNKELKLREVFDGFDGKGNELRFVRQ